MAFLISAVLVQQNLLHNKWCFPHTDDLSKAVASIGYYPGKRVTSVLLHEEWMYMYARGKAEGNIPLRGQQN